MIFITAAFLFSGCTGTREEPMPLDLNDQALPGATVPEGAPEETVVAPPVQGESTSEIDAMQRDLNSIEIDEGLDEDIQLYE
ncbi:MAG: hypothetical protein UW35_C0003G0045 [Candidatus Collierbacteria bacterium GW2011_GWF2_44_15]|uniref:Uncharacterized protein n=2 Tax=Candidatus Collieribacteriota TaxID=1752725 RepID=A0A0G1HKL3_9BACT|nr:MAG: hypothetical protein UW26_C0001G0002 [Candidatus Collierbacteria bacterium GW2011_GWF1_44_12]KKT47108.1 MAG: hypothetical protein UW35_C0003G0045 [Candidatus Collierbacteria bacterium GW2011_GWF2_44_15]